MLDFADEMKSNGQFNYVEYISPEDNLTELDVKQKAM